MKKIYSAIAAAVLSLMLVASCDVFAPKDFGDINVNPNAPSTAYTSYLFTMGCNYIPWSVLGDATNGFDPWQQLWNGYLSESQNNQYGALRSTAQYSRVGSVYLYGLKNMDMIIKMNEDPDQAKLPNVTPLGTTANQIAMAKTVSAFYYMFLTDMIGPIVMSEAFKGQSDDIWKPKYDTQKQVYTQLDEMLVEAFGQFDVYGTINPTYDVIYAGDIDKWKKFNASLRMLLAIKLCDVDPATGKSRFAKAYADGGMATVDDGFNFTYDDLHWNMLYYWTPGGNGSGNIVPNYIIVEAMKELQDPRMFQYFDIDGYKGVRKESIFPRDQYTSFYGVPLGLMTNPDVTAFSDCCASVNSKMLGMSATIPVIPAARVLLTEAEAALRGWISADAKDLYERGIAASFAQWGADGADAYIASPKVAYNASNALEQIATQRWIASYLSDGVEAWSDWRRLDIPKMPVGPLAVSKGSTQYPYRLMFYSDTDVKYNEDNYKAALSDLSDGDKTTSRVWWDVADNTEYVLTAEQCVPAVVIPAEWQVVCTGTYDYGADYDNTYFDDLKATLYIDVNHDGAYKISPWGMGGKYELFLTRKPNGDFVVDNQIVGTVTATDGTEYPVNVADYNTDQGADYEGMCYFDEDDQCYYFFLIYRVGGPKGGGSIGFLCYGNDAFIPD